MKPAKYVHSIVGNVNDGSPVLVDAILPGYEDIDSEKKPHSAYAFVAQMMFRLIPKELDGFTVLDAPGNELRLRTAPKCGFLPDSVSSLIGPFYVGPVLRSLIEELEPGVHRFVPFRTFSDVPIGGKTDHGEHYTLVVPPPPIACIDVERTDFVRPYNPKLSSLPNSPSRRVAIYRQDVAGRHYWIARVSDRSYTYMCSDILRQEYQKRRMRGWDFQKRCDLVDRVLH